MDPAISVYTSAPPKKAKATTRQAKGYWWGKINRKSIPYGEEQHHETPEKVLTIVHRWLRKLRQRRAGIGHKRAVERAIFGRNAPPVPWWKTCSNQGANAKAGIALRAAANQVQRAHAYRHYLGEALKHPNIVETHWFQYREQAIPGRNDGENYQIDFGDICDTPCQETIEAARRIGETMYRHRHGQP